MKDFKSPAFLYGESLFTSSRAKDGKMLFYRQHLDRLKKGIEAYYLDRELSQKEAVEIEQRIGAFLSGLESREKRVRISVSAGRREELFKARFDFSELDFYFQAQDLPTNFEPLQTKVFSNPFSGAYPDLKMGSYMPLLWLKTQAARAGRDEAVLADENGSFVETASANLFFYKGERLYTPEKRVLNGIVKKFIEKNRSVEKMEITLEKAAAFDGAFATNSVWGARQIQSIGQIAYKNLNPHIVQDMLKEILERGYEDHSKMEDA